MAPVLFDASVYINDLRAGTSGIISARFLRAGTPVWLSAVVLEELLAGASGPELTAVERLGRDFEKLRRLVVPTLDDWRAAGRTVAKLGTRCGYAGIAGGRLANRIA